MPTPGVHVETLRNPAEYTPAQIDWAVAIAHFLRRGKFVYCLPPERAR
jgi:hypothetical protein